MHCIFKPPSKGIPAMDGYTSSRFSISIFLAMRTIHTFGDFVWMLGLGATCLYDFTLGNYSPLLLPTRETFRILKSWKKSCTELRPKMNTRAVSHRSKVFILTWDNVPGLSVLRYYVTLPEFCIGHPVRKNSQKIKKKLYWNAEGTTEISGEKKFEIWCHTLGYNDSSG